MRFLAIALNAFESALRLLEEPTKFEAISDFAAVIHLGDASKLNSL